MDYVALSPFVWALIALAVGGIGCTAALKGWFAVSAEKKNLDHAKIELMVAEAWVDGFPIDEISLSNWLQKRGIREDSYIGDYIRACWSAWLGNRSASLAELHSLVSRRERARVSARLSGGIAALLLVIGIVGTLASVHPILKAFQFKVSKDGELQDVADSTDLVNSLINDLGEAFLPSLAALFGTIIVVLCRGFYFHALHRLTLELDGFAIGSLLPQYRPRSISGEYREVKKVLTGVSASIISREDSFERVVVELKSLVERIDPATKALEMTANTSQAASEKLSSRTKSISDGIARNLGKNSPMYKAVAGFEGIFHRTEKAMASLKALVEEIGASSRESRVELTTAVDEIRTGLNEIRTDNQNAQSEASEELLSQANAMQEQVDKATVTLPAKLDRVEKALAEAGEVERVSVQLIRDQAKQAAELMKTAADDNSDLEKAAKEQLRSQAEQTISQMKLTASQTGSAVVSKLDVPIKRMTRLIGDVKAKTIPSGKKKKRWYWPF